MANIAQSFISGLEQITERIKGEFRIHPHPSSYEIFYENYFIFKEYLR